MDPCQAETLRRAVLTLPRVEAAEELTAIKDFLELSDPSVALPASPVFPSPRLAERSATSARMTVTPACEPSSASPLDSASERLIADCLCGELPQTIAVALGQLTPQRASEVVSHLPAAVQTQVLERLVEDVPCTELQLTDIRDEFHLWLNQQIQRSLHRAELAARLAVILEATHPGTRQRILENVGQTDARLAKELQHRLAVSD
jgi:flagellar motor switch protein FliG